MGPSGPGYIRCKPVGLARLLSRLKMPIETHVVQTEPSEFPGMASATKHVMPIRNKGGLWGTQREAHEKL